MNKLHLPESRLGTKLTGDHLNWSKGVNLNGPNFWPLVTLSCIIVHSLASHPWTAHPFLRCTAIWVCIDDTFQWPQSHSALYAIQDELHQTHIGAVSEAVLKPFKAEWVLH